MAENQLGLSEAEMDILAGKVARIIHDQFGIVGLKRSLTWHGKELEYYLDEGNPDDLGIPMHHIAHREKEKGPVKVLFVESPFKGGEVGKYMVMLFNEHGGSQSEQLRKFLDVEYPQWNIMMTRQKMLNETDNGVDGQ